MKLVLLETILHLFGFLLQVFLQGKIAKTTIQKDDIHTLLAEDAEEAFVVDKNADMVAHSDFEIAATDEAQNFSSSPYTWVQNLLIAKKSQKAFPPLISYWYLFLLITKN